jgi:hypothetical protein
MSNGFFVKTAVLWPIPEGMPNDRFQDGALKS